jgi:hypothetical protein
VCKGFEVGLLCIEFYGFCQITLGKSGRPLDLPVGGEGDDFLLLTSVLHQKTIKCHRASVVCDDEYVWHSFIVLVLILPDHDRQIAVALLPLRLPSSFLSSYDLLPVRPKTTKTLRCI